MNPVIRWCRFNLVGAVGMMVQLGSLTLLNRWFGGRYLIASVIALELTLLHNFIWHLHYTWRDRSGHGGVLGQLWRFHLANGLVSMLGNVAIIWTLVHGARSSLLLANFIAILCCSLVNFCLSDLWAFAVKIQGHGRISDANELRAES